MKIFGIELNGKKETVSKPINKKIEANHGILTGSYSVSFDGEKNPGEIGPAVDYTFNYNMLRVRSWQSYLESEISRTVFDRFTIWIIDKGLKLQSEPSKIVLESEGINIDTEKFNEIVEARFNLFAKSMNSSYSQMQTLNQIAKETFKSAKIGGDSLVVIRYKNNQMTVQLIDGSMIDSPFYGFTTETGNKVIDGVEVDSSGKHIAYHIPGKLGQKNQRIPAWSETTGLRMAFLIYGSKHRSTNVRGIPAISTSLETLKKIDRYKEAMVAGAEERAKIAYFIKHNQFSDGENPLDGISNAFSDDTTNETVIPVDEQGEILANKVAATTNKTVFNMPIGADLISVSSAQEMQFKEFYEQNANIICAALGIPPNVAWSLYNDSFSASRAATKDWEHTIDVERNEFQVQFYEPIYKFWLYTEILKNKIPAEGFADAIKNNNNTLIEAYLNCRFTGPMFPHIDPLKEVKAERLKLGAQFDNTPLTTVEKATEALFAGDSNSNVEQASKELDKSKELGFEPEQIQNSDFSNEG